MRKFYVMYAGSQKLHVVWANNETEVRNASNRRYVLTVLTDSEV